MRVEVQIPRLGLHGPGGLEWGGKRADGSGSSLDLSECLARGGTSFFLSFFNLGLRLGKKKKKREGYWRGTGFVSVGQW